MASVPQLELTCAAMPQAMAAHMSPELRRLRRENAQLTQKNNQLTSMSTWKEDQHRQLYHENQRLRRENDKLRQIARDRSNRTDFLE